MQEHGDHWVERGAISSAKICAAAPNAAVESRCRDYYDAKRREVVANDQPAGAGQEEMVDD
jgi:hypothetical protein